MDAFNGKVMLTRELAENFARRTGIMTTGYGMNDVSVELRLLAPDMHNDERDHLLNRLCDYLRAALIIADEWIARVDLRTGGHDPHGNYFDPAIVVLVDNPAFMGDETEDRVLRAVDTFLTAFGRQNDYTFYTLKGRQQLVPLRFELNFPQNRRLSALLPAELKLSLNGALMALRDKATFRMATVTFERLLKNMLFANGHLVDVEMLTLPEFQLVLSFPHGTLPPPPYVLNTMEQIACTALNLCGRPNYGVYNEVLAVPTSRHQVDEYNYID